MPSTLPDGEPAPPDGGLPAAALASVPDTPLSFYLHVPFCTTRCGYCDFNTYTAQELGDAPGASRSGYADAAIAEIDLARRVLGDAAPPVGTVFTVVDIIQKLITGRTASMQVELRRPA